MGDLVQAATEAWEHVAERRMPIVMGAVITSTALAMMKLIQQQLRDICADPNPEALKERLTQVQEAQNFFHASKGAPVQTSTPMIEKLQLPWAVLKQCQNETQPTRKNQGSTVFEKPTDFFQRDHQDTKDLDRECMSRVVQSMIYNDQDHIATLVLHDKDSSLAQSIKNSCLKKDFSGCGLEMSSGLVLLNETYRSYLLSSTTAIKQPNCRLEMLKFGQEIIPCIDAVLNDPSMLCRCSHTIAAHLELFKDHLLKSLGEKTFNLYSQSPWICGSQMLEMLRCVSYYGLRLLSYCQYFGTVVHCYHMVRIVTNFQEIPILEGLIDSFEENLFPGRRPDRNFRTCAMRFFGGQLKFAHASHHRSGCHKMVIPSSSITDDGSGLMLEANAGRFNFWRHSWFFNTQIRGYHLKEVEWSTVDRTAQILLASCQHIAAEAPFAKDEPVVKIILECASSIGVPSHRLQRLMQLVLVTDFRRHFPLARVNYLKLYMASVRVIDIVSDRDHPDTPGLRCQCFFERMADAVDTFTGHGSKRTFEPEDLVKDITAALREVFGDSTVEDYLWKGV